MAVTYDSSAGLTKVWNNTPGVGDPLTFSLKQFNPSNSAVIFAIAWSNQVGNLFGDQALAISSVILGGSAVTFKNFNFFDEISVETWFITGKSGTNTISITIDDTANPGGNIFCTMIGEVVAVSGARQSGPIIQYLTNTGTVSPITMTGTTNSNNNLLIDSPCINESAGVITLTPASGNTIRKELQAGTLSSRMHLAMSTKAATGGSDTMSETESANRDWAQSWMEIGFAQGAAAGNFSVKGSLGLEKRGFFASNTNILGGVGKFSVVK